MISVPRGAEITVSEANGYYTASYRIGNGEAQRGHAVTQYVLSDDTAIAFTNTLNAAAPTGVSIRAVPFTALMLAGLLLFAVALTGKRRGKEDA